jgi:hypothetical protein
VYINKYEIIIHKNTERLKHRKTNRRTEKHTERWGKRQTGSWMENKKADVFASTYFKELFYS